MGKLTKQIGVRLTLKIYDLLKRIANARGEDVSDFVRRAIYKELADLSFLSKEQEKALGLTREGTQQRREERIEA